MTREPVDVLIVGAGLVGLATARALLASGATDAVRVLDKEPGPARHQSTHNSGVLHAGLAYTPGSSKARLAREGIRRMVDFCRDRGVSHDICGKLVVATTPAEVERLTALEARGRANGLVGLRRLTPDQAREREPGVRCLAALLVPEEGIVSFRGVADALAAEIAARGGTLTTGAEVRGATRSRGRWQVETPAGTYEARVVVTCAGLHADRVARRFGARSPVRILPFRGEYQRLRPASADLVRHLVYPVARPGFPFLGVHFTRRIDGTVDAGPNAVLAFAREGYRRRDVDVRDLVEALSFPGLRRFVMRHPAMVAEEFARSFVRSRSLAGLRRMVPALTASDLEPGGAGVRAQAVRPDGRLVDDFEWVEGPGAVHVLNAPSPAATACLAIGREVASRAERVLARA